MAKLTVVDDVTARLASHRTPKQRSQRLKQLRMTLDGSGYMDARDALEECLLKLQMKNRRLVVTKELVQIAYAGATRAMMSGEIPIALNIDGERFPIPPPGLPH